MPRVVLDTNIYVSALLTPGKARQVLEQARRRQFELLISEPIIAEIERVLRLKIGWADFQIAIVLREIREIATLISPAQRLHVVNQDDADNRILECAAEGQADFLVSGDVHHLLALQRHGKTTILSSAQFLELGNRN